MTEIHVEDCDKCWTPYWSDQLTDGLCIYCQETYSGNPNWAGVDKTDLEQFIEVKKKEESSAPLSVPIKSSNTDLDSRKEVLINDKYS